MGLVAMVADAKDAKDWKMAILRYFTLKTNVIAAVSVNSIQNKITR